jgi:hypothetical protein
VQLKHILSPQCRWCKVGVLVVRSPSQTWPLPRQSSVTRVAQKQTGRLRSCAIWASSATKPLKSSRPLLLGNLQDFELCVLLLHEFLCSGACCLNPVRFLTAHNQFNLPSAAAVFASRDCKSTKKWTNILFMPFVWVSILQKTRVSIIAFRTSLPSDKMKM